MRRTEAVLQHLPELRRYVRAMTGSLEVADRLIEHALAEMVTHPRIIDDSDPRESLFSRFHLAVGYPSPPPAGRETPATGQEERLALQVASLDKESRAVLVLRQVLGFTTDQVARILGMAPSAAAEAVRAARRRLAKLAFARVLIIEDDYLIAQEIAHLVEAVGQHVSGPAATYAEAIACAADHTPTLVLADIQLRGGRVDGLRAGSELAREHGVPLIVITAYPERLAQEAGVQPEQTFTKPFDYAALRGAITNPPGAA